GVFKSADGGGHWEERNRGLLNVFVTCLAVDPRNPSVVYAGTNSGGVFRSADGAASWTAANTGLSSRIVWSLTFGAGTPPALYAATDEGLFKSSPPGSALTAPSPEMHSIFVLSSAPAPGAVTLSAGRAADLYRSRDSGATWESSSLGLTNSFVSALAVNPKNSRSLYAGTNCGVFKSTDGGRHWA